MKSLRILIIRNAYQKDTGGAEQYALNLAIALKTAGHKPVLVTKVKQTQEKAKINNIKHINGKWYDEQGWSRLYYILFPLITFWYIYVIIRHGIDVVHPMSRDDFVFASNAGYILNKKIVWSDHADLKYILDNTNHYNPRMRRWVINASKHASEIISTSYSDRKAVIEVAPDLPKTTLIHNGVFTPKDINPIKKTNKLIVGTNARLVEDKGISELMKGFAALKNENVDLWLLGGYSGNKTTYENLAKKLGILNHVSFLGYVNKPNDVVAAMDVFVHPSYMEAFSLAIIEAAMLGRPIIATNVGGTPEIIDNTCGILIEPRDPVAITNAINKLLVDASLRKQIGDTIRIKAEREFDFQKIVEKKIIPLYLKL